MSTSSPAFSQDPSAALLALKRFVRGTLRPLGVVFFSLMLVLGMSPHLPVVAASPETAFPQATHAAQRRLVAMPPAHLLKAHMTHHHLTGARLSIPAASHYAVASLRESK